MAHSGYMHSLASHPCICFVNRQDEKEKILFPYTLTYELLCNGTFWVQAFVSLAAVSLLRQPSG
jgi:hypothetical protein